MIRFLIGCLLAIALLWATLITVGFFALPYLEHRQHQPAAGVRR